MSDFATWMHKVCSGPLAVTLADTALMMRRMKSLQYDAFRVPDMHIVCLSRGFKHHSVSLRLTHTPMCRHAAVSSGVSK